MNKLEQQNTNIIMSKKIYCYFCTKETQDNNCLCAKCKQELWEEIYG